MRIGFLVLLLSLFASSALAGQRGLLIKGVDVFDGTSDKLLENRSVLVQGARIVEIGPPTLEPPTVGYKIVEGHTKDGRRLTLMPAFVDLHTHVFVSGGPHTDFGARVSQADNLRTHVLSGVLMVADLLTYPESMRQIRETSGYIEFPQVVAAGPLFTATGGHGTQFNTPAHKVDKESDVEAEWEAHLAGGAQIAKATLEPATWLRFPGKPVSEWPTLDQNALIAIGKKAKAAGQPFFVHIWTNEHAWAAARAGADALAHGIFTGAVEERVIQAMKQSGTAYVPTLSVVLNPRRASEESFWQSLSGKVCPSLIERIRKGQVGGDSMTAEASLGPKERFFDNLKRIHAAGIPLGIGTDAGNPYVFQGPSVHHEIDYFIEAGIPLPEVMRIATSGSAKILGALGAHHGQVKPDFHANLILVEGNPLTDPKAHWRVVAVIRNGLVVPLDKIRRTVSRESCLAQG